MPIGQVIPELWSDTQTSTKTDRQTDCMYEDVGVIPINFIQFFTNVGVVVIVFFVDLVETVLMYVKHVIIKMCKNWKTLQKILLCNFY